MHIGTQTVQEYLQITIISQKVDEKSSIETEGIMGGQGGAPLGVPPPLGERGGQSQNCLNYYSKIKCDKNSSNL
jgi:hypothetical protein